MLFNPAPGGVLVGDGLIVLFNGASTGDAMSEASSLFATTRTVITVVHSSVRWGWGLTERIAVTGPEPAAFEAGWRRYLSEQDVTAEQVERLLRETVEPSRVIELATLAKYKVGVGALNNGFYWKPSGAWTWRGMALRSTAAAQALRDFFDGKLTAQGQAPGQAHPDGEVIALGSAVLVRWTDGGTYTAQIVGAESGGYWVLFEGGRRQWVPATHLSPLPRDAPPSGG